MSNVRRPEFSKRWQILDLRWRISAPVRRHKEASLIIHPAEQGSMFEPRGTRLDLASRPPASSNASSRRTAS